MDATAIIKKPLVTEKNTTAMEQNRYAFEVDKRANKHQIRSAIRELYGVRIVGVATKWERGKTRRTRHGYTKTASRKQAIVKVHPDDRIELF